MTLEIATKEELDKFNHDVKWYNYTLENSNRMYELEGKIFENFRVLAEKGYAPAQYIMGVADIRGDFDAYPRNESAFTWLESSAEKDFFPASSYFVSFYEEEVVHVNYQTIKQDYKKAAEVYYQNAIKGDLYGQYRLGSMYVHGNGVPKCLIHGYAWISVAKASGYFGGKNGLEELEAELAKLEKQDDFNLIKAREKAAEIWESIDRSFITELDKKFGIESRYVMR